MSKLSVFQTTLVNVQYQISLNNRFSGYEVPPMKNFFLPKWTKAACILAGGHWSEKNLLQTNVFTSKAYMSLQGLSFTDRPP